MIGRVKTEFNTRMPVFEVTGDHRGQSPWEQEKPKYAATDLSQGAEFLVHFPLNFDTF
jgi:hypothetical protein